MAMVKERLKVDWTSVNRTAFIDAMIRGAEKWYFHCAVDIDCEGLRETHQLRIRQAAITESACGAEEEVRYFQRSKEQ